MYDIVVIGGGPAGLAAAVNARRRNKTVVVMGKEEFSSKLVLSHEIENYLGLPGMTGNELAQKMQVHALGLGVEFVKDEAQNIIPEDGHFTVFGRENSLEALAVILTVGISLGAEIERETEFIGKGVSYCVTCDGMFFKGKNVAVVGYIPAAEEELGFLLDICKQVYYLPQYSKVGTLDARVTAVNGKPTAIEGNGRVERLRTSAGELVVDGVFIERSGRPVDQLVPGLATDGIFIITNADQATNLPGVFAAGDCTGRPWQISRATGQGQVAALSAVHYLEALR